MSAASWFRLSKRRALTAVLSKSARRKPPRQPIRSLPSLEYLEERIVPDAASGNLGIVNNASVNFQGGITLVPNPPFANLSGVAVGVFASPLNGSGALNLPQLGQGFPNNVPSFTQTAFGFGSGTQPGQPWVPNSYNLGLANQQTAFPTLGDRGFQAPPPWVRQIAHFQEKNADTDPDEQGAPPRNFLAAIESTEDDNQADEISAYEDAGDHREEWIDPDGDSTLHPISLVPHAATEANDTEAVVTIQTRAARLAPPEAAVPQENGMSKTGSASWDDEPSLPENDGPQDLPTLESLNLPSALVLSVLTPAQMMALLTEFPFTEGRKRRSLRFSFDNEDEE